MALTESPGRACDGVSVTRDTLRSAIVTRSVAARRLFVSLFSTSDAAPSATAMTENQPLGTSGTVNERETC